MTNIIPLPVKGNPDPIDGRVGKQKKDHPNRLKVCVAYEVTEGRRTVEVMDRPARVLLLLMKAASSGVSPAECRLGYHALKDACDTLSKRYRIPIIQLMIKSKNWIEPRFQLGVFLDLVAIEGDLEDMAP